MSRLATIRIQKNGGVVTGFEEISCQEERCMAWQKEEKTYPTGNPYKDIILIPAHCKLINK
jgi:hypothetical protein